MRVFHNSRDVAYRNPYGAIEVGGHVMLAVDVWDAPGARVSLRTWVDGVGEKLYEMEHAPVGAYAGEGASAAVGAYACVANACVANAGEDAGAGAGAGVGAGEDAGAGAGVGAGEDAGAGENACERFAIDFAPEGAGVVWYQFVITDAWGGAKRYGAQNGRFGGVGQLLDWEPPSFRLVVAERSDDGSRAGGMRPADMRPDGAQSAGAQADGARPDGAQSAGPRPDGARPDGPEAACFPFTDDVVRFMRGELGARELAELVEEQREAVPQGEFLRPAKLLGGRGDELLLAQLSGVAPVGAVDGAQIAAIHMDDGQRGLGKGRLWCASLVQMLMPAETDVYADEAGSPCEWAFGADGGDADCETIVRNAFDIRQTLPLFSDGGFSCFAANDDVFGVWRVADDGTAACLLVNGSLHDAHDVDIPLVGETVSEVVGGLGLPILDASEAGGTCCADGSHDGEGASPLDAYRLACQACAARAGLAEGAGLTCEPFCRGGRARTRLPGPANPLQYARVHLYQVGSAILYFHPAQRLDRPVEAGLGVLAHITSLPAGGSEADGARRRSGTLGEPARRFVDWLAEAGVRYWQVLPVNPTDEHGSPYAGISAFAGNTRLLEDGQRPPLREGGMGSNPPDESGSIGAAPHAAATASPAAPHAAATASPAAPHAAAAASPAAPHAPAAAAPAAAAASPAAAAPAPAAADPEGYRAFCEREKDWLEPYACFMAIRQKLGSDMVWQKWPKKYRRFDPGLVAGDPELRAFAEAWRRAQFDFEVQWKELRAYANERGVQIIGDMPIYVSADSADVWANPGIFQLGADGAPDLVAGCPPDQFAVEGQVWGNPVYDWDALRESGYGWWLRRLERAFGLYDLVRLDHFIGFARYFSIPAGQKAAEGRYRPGPGLGFFRAAYEKFGPLPVIAEDLGSITPAVRTLGAACGFPGMDVVQFVDGNDPLSGYRPRPGKIAYAGTHDNQTLVGYAAARYPDLDAEETAARLAELVAGCSAPVRIFQLQDLMGLDDAARMNVPGTVDGNWEWQARSRDFERALERARTLVALGPR